MWQSPPSNVKMAGCRTLKETLRSHWERGRLARGLCTMKYTPQHRPSPQILKVPSYMHISCLE